MKEIIFIVGNQSDLPASQKEVDLEQAEQVMVCYLMCVCLSLAVQLCMGIVMYLAKRQVELVLFFGFCRKLMHLSVSLKVDTRALLR